MSPDAKRAGIFMNEKGHLMAGLLVLLAIMLIFSTVVFQDWQDLAHRENEAEMIFRLGARQAADYTPLWNTYETAVEPELAAAWNDEPMQRILLTDLGLSLPADMLHKVDLASMAHGLEVRVPFLDPAVVEYATSLPVAYKLDGTNRKRVLIDAHRDLLPPGIADRPKMGFEVPIGEFLRRELRDMFHDVVDRRTIDSFGWLDYDGIHELYHAHCRRQDDYADLLYALLVLCWWRRRTR